MLEYRIKCEALPPYAGSAGMLLHIHYFKLNEIDAITKITKPRIYNVTSSLSSQNQLNVFLMGLPIASRPRNRNQEPFL